MSESQREYLSQALRLPIGDVLDTGQATEVLGRAETWLSRATDDKTRPGYYKQAPGPGNRHWYIREWCEAVKANLTYLKDGRKVPAGYQGWPAPSGLGDIMAIVLDWQAREIATRAVRIEEGIAPDNDAWADEYDRACHGTGDYEAKAREVLGQGMPALGRDLFGPTEQTSAHGAAVRIVRSAWGKVLYEEKGMRIKAGLFRSPVQRELR